MITTVPPGCWGNAASEDGREWIRRARYLSVNKQSDFAEGTLSYETGQFRKELVCGVKILDAEADEDVLGEYKCLPYPKFFVPVAGGVYLCKNFHRVTWKGHIQGECGWNRHVVACVVE